MAGRFEEVGFLCLLIPPEYAGLSGCVFVSKKKGEGCFHLFGYVYEYDYV